MRYHDLESGTTSYYQDYFIMIRIVAQTNLTLSRSSFDHCPWNPFPMSYGNNYYGYELWYGSFFANATDNNIIIGGNANY